MKPQGSGVEGAPIVIASDGEGKKPILKPGADWTISHMNSANKVVRNPREMCIRDSRNAAFRKRI